MTNGIIVVGVTDGICEINTEWKEKSKKAAGMTYSKVIANNFLLKLNEQNFVSFNPFNNEEFLLSEIDFTYHNCKIVKFNYSNDINSEEYILTNSAIQQIAESIGFNKIDEPVKNSSSEEMSTSSIILIIFFGIIILNIICIVIFFACCQNCFKKSS